MQQLMEMKREGLSTQAISKLTGYDRKTVRKYLLKPETVPRYGPRAARPSKLDAHKPYLQDRMKAGVWNAQVLLRELRKLGYQGGYTILKDWLQPQRSAGTATAVRRFETPPGKQAQVDWGHLGYLDTRAVGYRDPQRCSECHASRSRVRDGVAFHPSEHLGERCEREGCRY